MPTVSGRAGSGGRIPASTPRLGGWIWCAWLRRGCCRSRCATNRLPGCQPRCRATAAGSRSAGASEPTAWSCPPTSRRPTRGAARRNPLPAKTGGRAPHRGLATSI